MSKLGFVEPFKKIYLGSEIDWLGLILFLILLLQIDKQLTYNSTLRNLIHKKGI